MSFSKGESRNMASLKDVWDNSAGENQSSCDHFPLSMQGWYYYDGCLKHVLATVFSAT